MVYMRVCMLQNGLQPIHYAAQNGYENIVMTLVNDFNVKPDAVTLVCTCVVKTSTTIILCSF